MNLMSKPLPSCKRNTTGITREAGTAYPSGAPALTPYFSGVCVAESLVCCVVFYAIIALH